MSELQKFCFERSGHLGFKLIIMRRGRRNSPVKRSKLTRSNSNYLANYKIQVQMPGKLADVNKRK
jgi:hypothetical protein